MTLSSAVTPVLLLIASNVFMTFACIGHAAYSAAELKTMQEVVMLAVFAGFSVLYLREPLAWNRGGGFALIAAGAFPVFHRW